MGHDAGEQVEVLLRAEGVRIERIVSRGHCSPPGFWYDQHEHEWVIVIEGAAELEFGGPDERRSLQPGDHLLIPAHRKHRVAWTAPDEPVPCGKQADLTPLLAALS
jgi:cupin 2 domain-containing protein